MAISTNGVPLWIIGIIRFDPMFTQIRDGETFVGTVEHQFPLPPGGNGGLQWCADFLRAFYSARKRYNKLNFDIVSQPARFEVRKESKPMAFGRQSSDRKSDSIPDGEMQNRVSIAGTVKLFKDSGSGVFMLIDADGSGKFIPVTAHEKEQKNDKSIEGIAAISEGDFIHIAGYVRPWGKKNGDEWKNALEVRATKLLKHLKEKRDLDRRGEQSSSSRDNFPVNDDIPF